ncbi:MAG: LuxR C-terminal-related transcriptional regulator, partial [Pyrinomonadaceae bacterium]|nr:LuxR C-terminal-related transcriptional regulator [Pyrinomonadaceae bacterium]
KHNPVRNFDLQVTTPKGRQWCNVSVLIADDAGLKHPYTIHILRQINTRKRLELLVKDFLVSEIDLPEREAAAVIQSSRSPVGETELTQRELEILKLLATGQTSTAMGKALHISRNTVDNHVQHILKKLNAHSRLEAVRIAERAGLFIRSTNGNSTSGNGAHA